MTGKAWPPDLQIRISKCLLPSHTRLHTLGDLTLQKLILAKKKIFQKHWLNFLKSPITIISYNLKQRESNWYHNTLYCSELQKIYTNINLEHGNNITGSRNSFIVFTGNYWNPPQWQLSSPFQLPWQLPWMDATTGNPTWTSMHEIITEKPPKINVKFTLHLWRILFFCSTLILFTILENGLENMVCIQLKDVKWLIFLEHKFIYSVPYWHIQTLSKSGPAHPDFVKGGGGHTRPYRPSFGCKIRVAQPSGPLDLPLSCDMHLMYLK